MSEGRGASMAVTTQVPLPASRSGGHSGTDGKTGAVLAPERSGRSLVLDALKGELVLVMVLYHWLNYFVTSDPAVYKYLRFVTPSFIFVAGFLVTNGYLKKYRIGEQALHGRLMVRGVKLLALFIVLNMGGVMVAILMGGHRDRVGAAGFLAGVGAVNVTEGAKYAAFQVLVPISYLLVASALLLWGCKLHRHFLWATWLVSVGGIYLLKWKGSETGTAELFGMGLLGMAVGRFAQDTIDLATRRPAAWIGGYTIYLVALQFYDAIYELQVAGLILNLVVLYMLARKLVRNAAVGGTLVVLGQYSLLGYVAQIAILQVGRHAMRPFEMGFSSYPLSLVGTLVLTYLAVAVTRLLRRRWSAVDTLYRFVFA